jgi:WD40 repeat protein
MVARREIQDYRIVLIGAAAVSLLPFLIPALRGLQGETALEARDQVAIFVAGLYIVGSSVGLGWTVVAREISNRRIAFFLARPLSNSAVWWGKVFGSLAIAVGGMAVTLAPTFAANKWVLPKAGANVPTLAEILMASVVLFFASNAVSVAFRAPWLLLLDFVLAAVAVLLLQLLAPLFVFNWALGAWVIGLGVLTVVALVGLIAAGFASLARGRSDIRAAHRGLSATFWCLVFAGITLFWLYSFWVFAARPKDISAVSDAEAVPRGDWIVVKGEARGRFGYEPTFLWKPSSGDFVRVGPHLAAPVFSKDGQRAAWLRWRQIAYMGREIVDLDLISLQGPLRRVSTGISISLGEPPVGEWPGALVFSPSGDRIAEFHHRILSVYDILAGKTLASVRLPSSGSVFSNKFWFLSEDRLRFFASANGNGSPDAPLEQVSTLTIFDVDVLANRAERTGSIDVDGRIFPILLSPSGDRLLLRGGSTRKQISLHESQTGKLIRTLAEATSPDSVWGDFLSDGQIVVASVHDGKAKLRLFSSEAEETRSIELGSGEHVFFGGEPASGQLLVGTGPGGERRNMNGTIWMIDLKTGSSHRVGRGLYPTVSFPRLMSADPRLPLSPGSRGTRLFYGPEKSLLELDPVTGERRTILAGHASR